MLRIRFAGPSWYYRKRAWFFSYHHMQYGKAHRESRITILGVEFWW